MKRGDEAFVNFIVRLEAMWRVLRVDFDGVDERYCVEKVREKLPLYVLEYLLTVPGCFTGTYENMRKYIVLLDTDPGYRHIIRVRNLQNKVESQGGGSERGGNNQGRGSERGGNNREGRGGGNRGGRGGRGRGCGGYEPRVNTRICRNCNNMGHIAANCPFTPSNPVGHINPTPQPPTQRTPTHQPRTRTPTQPPTQPSRTPTQPTQPPTQPPRTPTQPTQPRGGAVLPVGGQQGGQWDGICSEC